MVEIPGYRELVHLQNDLFPGFHIIHSSTWARMNYPATPPLCGQQVIVMQTLNGRLFAVGRTGDDSPWEVREYAVGGREYCWITREDLTLADQYEPVDPNNHERMKEFIRQYVHTLKERSCHFDPGLCAR